MNNETTPGQSENFIEQVKVTYYLSRMLAQSGVLELRENTLTFYPSGALEKTLGAKPINILLDDIKKIYLDSVLPKKLTIKTAIKTHLFVGRYIDPLHIKLKDILEKMKQAKEDSYEEVIEEEKVKYFVSKLRIQSGLLHMTPKRLIFTPIGFLDIATGASDFQIPIDIITGIRVFGTLEKKTSIATTERVYDFQGKFNQNFQVKLIEAVEARKSANFQGISKDSQIPKSSMIRGEPTIPVGPHAEVKPDSREDETGACTNCRKRYGGDYNYCPYCGSKLVK